jgi:hypothetical protein
VSAATLTARSAARVRVLTRITPFRPRAHRRRPQPRLQPAGAGRYAAVGSGGCTHNRVQRDGAPATTVRGPRRRAAARLQRRRRLGRRRSGPIGGCCPTRRRLSLDPRPAPRPVGASPACPSRTCARWRW